MAAGSSISRAELRAGLSVARRVKLAARSKACWPRLDQLALQRPSFSARACSRLPAPKLHTSQQRPTSRLDGPGRPYCMGRVSHIGSWRAVCLLTSTGTLVLPASRRRWSRSAWARCPSRRRRRCIRSLQLVSIKAVKCGLVGLTRAWRWTGRTFNYKQSRWYEYRPV